MWDHLKYSFSAIVSWFPWVIYSKSSKKYILKIYFHFIWASKLIFSCESWGRPSPPFNMIGRELLGSLMDFPEYIFIHPHDQWVLNSSAELVLLDYNLRILTFGFLGILFTFMINEYKVQAWNIFRFSWCEKVILWFVNKICGFLWPIIRNEIE